MSNDNTRALRREIFHNLLRTAYIAALAVAAYFIYFVWVLPV